MTHWQAVFSDVWSVLRWLMPLILGGFGLVDALSREEDQIPMVMWVVSLIGTYLAIAGVWV